MVWALIGIIAVLLAFDILQSFWLIGLQEKLEEATEKLIPLEYDWDYTKGGGWKNDVD